MDELNSPSDHILVPFSSDDAKSPFDERTYIRSPNTYTNIINDDEHDPNCRLHRSKQWGNQRNYPNQQQQYQHQSQQQQQPQSQPQEKFQNQFQPPHDHQPLAVDKEPVSKQKTAHKQDKRDDGVKITKRACAQLINDLSFLKKLENEGNGPNVVFKIKNQRDGDELKMHSLVLLARSNYFRRSWRFLKSQPTQSQQQSDKKPKYDFDYNFNENLSKANIEIKLESQKEDLKIVSDSFQFNVDIRPSADDIKPTEEKKERAIFLNSFKQLKRFLYNAECEVTEQNAVYLAALAFALEIESLQDYLINFFTEKLDRDNIEDLLEKLEISYVFQLLKLKAECIKIINISPRQIVNSVPWKRISQKYPKLVLEIFYENK